MRTQKELDLEFATPPDFSAAKGFLLVGIAGAGMSGIARMLRDRGANVRGTDLGGSTDFDALINEGFEVRLGHHADAVRPGDIVVLTDAIDLTTSPEVRAARELGCPLARRSQVLAWLLKGKRLIAVTGTHGKTTTTSMIGVALRAAGADPTIVVGAQVPELGGCIVAGDGSVAVIEACEAYDSLRDFSPDWVVLTNLEPDHLDFHGDWAGVKRTVKRFVDRIPADGALFYCAGDDGARELAAEVTARAVPYQDSWNGHALALPGDHNRLNASAAVAVVEALGLPKDKAVDAIAAFKGADRRFQVQDRGDVVLIDDYAHHPKEIDATLQAVRERFPGRRCVVVFQPHLYSRTADFLPEFGRSLSAADLLVLTDIYPAREAPMPGMSSLRIGELATCPVRYIPSRHLLPREVAKVIEPGDVVVGMGAGTISEFIPGLVAELDRPRQLNIVVALGGDSGEREVSLHSGRSVAAALRRNGHLVRELDISEALLSGKGLGEMHGANRPDVVFLAVHGNRAEDGAIQGLFELLHIPYTGSDIQTSAVAMDKQLTKMLLQSAGVPVPEGVLLQPGAEFDPAKVPGTSWVVKPNAQGSTVGLSFVTDRSELTAAVEKARAYGDQVLIETWLRGMEISVPVLCGRALPVVEIVPASGVYDFASKYEPGATEEVVPARLSPEFTVKVQEIALKAHELLGCRGASRTDMIVVGDQPYVLEVNTLPGMTATSLLPNSAAAAGISYDQLCEEIIHDALDRQATPS